MIKKLILTMGFFIILLTIGMFSLFAFKDYNALKPQAILKIKDLSNIEIAINGDLKPVLSPFGFLAEDIEVLNLNNEEESNLFSARTLNIVLNKKAMFVGKSEIKELIFKDANSSIVKDIVIENR